MANTILKLVNQRGIPTLGVVSVASNGTNTVFTLVDHPFIGYKFSGFFVIRVTQTVATSAEPVIFTTEGLNNNIPLQNAEGAAVTAADVVSTGTVFHLCFYDRESNKLQLIA